VLACLDDARRQAQTSFQEKRYRDVAAAAARLDVAFDQEAQEVGADSELAQFRESCRFIEALAGRASP
jgi:hypothetical protein